mmetsp:Transcript_25577/g.43674  ORF Transcript_25577/g.43674 Transcript_25577/m.43674 type:complete len:86 (-) Transcript_25577:79-336(-)|eukprot:CAMPEP_0183786504 /NCGR_PEP_ID=MMETSP0739-20130205/67060_1 /TAXON_ID=385413 /ORGANISM="Thalassiosira miniscula, Strain CCMP1093" /LENGTH=85 /DNA_ID=CAMNT_0026030555 /DNA_START=798 /DNA_END=1055 /DNA_ORIENTATION=-
METEAEKITVGILEEEEINLYIPEIEEGPNSAEETVTLIVLVEAISGDVAAVEEIASVITQNGMIMETQEFSLLRPLMEEAWRRI